MIFKSDGAASGDLNGFLDRGSTIEGELRFDTSFRVDGVVRGTVVSEGDLVVGDGGEVSGEINVGQIFVTGIIRGQIEALRRVHVAPGGRVYADISTPALVIENGAVFEGRCVMNRPDEAAARVPVRPRPAITPMPVRGDKR